MHWLTMVWLVKVRLQVSGVKPGIFSVAFMDALYEFDDAMLYV